MKFQVISDTHFELKSNLKTVCLTESYPDTILILCGDIGNPFEDAYRKFLGEVKSLYLYVVVIAGNHEYYNLKKSMIEVDEQIRNVCDAFDNVKFLQNEVFDFVSTDSSEEFMIFGSTLWSNIPKIYEGTILRSIGDYRYIKNFSPSICNELNEIAIKKLEYFISLSESLNKKLIVVTHHMPSFKLIDSKYKIYESINHAFANDLDYLIKSPITAWFFGHTHCTIDTSINEVRVLCNPHGYNTHGIRENKNFKVETFISL